MKTKRRKWILAIGALLAVWVLGVFFALGIRTNDGHRAGCLFNQRNVTTAARAYANVNDINAGAPMDPSQVLRFGEIKELKCASGGTYKWKATIPAFGESAVACSLKDHQPESTANW